MTVEELLEEAKGIWDGKQQELNQITVLMGVIYGDICRQARNQQEGKIMNAPELKKELGNMIFSTIRWCSELGYDPKECVEAAKEAQRAYVKSLDSLKDTW
jgi:biotin carboxylase